MQIEHIALWTRDLEKVREFYEKYFQAKTSQKYRNPVSQNESYFLHFSSGAQLEIMSMPGLEDLNREQGQQYIGYTHVAFSVGSEEVVDALTNTIESDGHKVIRKPRHTGDGYYESIILDPDGNRIEITV